MRPHRASQRCHRLDLREYRACRGQLVGEHAIVALMGGEARKGGSGHRRDKATEQFGIDRAGAFEPAAEIDAALVQDGFGVPGRPDAGDQFAHRIIMAAFHMGGRRHEAHARGDKFGKDIGGINCADARGDVSGPQPVEQGEIGRLMVHPRSSRSLASVVRCPGAVCWEEEETCPPTATARLRSLRVSQKVETSTGPVFPVRPNDIPRSSRLTTYPGWALGP